MSPVRRAFDWFVANRRRAAPLVLMVGLLVVVSQVLPGWPRETDLVLELGSTHREVTEVRVDYALEGETVKAVTLRYPSGAPRRVRHHVELAPGRYEIAVALLGAEGRVLERRLDVPAEGEVHLDCGGDR